MTESLQIGEMIRQAVVDRYGEHELSDRYQAFDTICSATQDRQDAVVALLREHAVDLMIVIGGYNSSNTRTSPVSAQRPGPRSTLPIRTVWCRRKRFVTARWAPKRK
jgi:Penicillin tolerance protein